MAAAPCKYLHPSPDSSRVSNLIRLQDQYANGALMIQRVSLHQTQSESFLIQRALSLVSAIALNPELRAGNLLSALRQIDPCPQKIHKSCSSRKYRGHLGAEILSRVSITYPSYASQMAHCCMLASKPSQMDNLGLRLDKFEELSHDMRSCVIVNDEKNSRVGSRDTNLTK